MPENNVPSKADEPIVPPVVAEPPKIETVEKSKYDASVKEMNAKQREAAIAKKEAELLRQELEIERRNRQAPTTNIDPNAEPPQQVKEALEAKYKMPYEQIKLNYDMRQLDKAERDELKKQLADLNNQILEDRYENTKGRLKNEDKLFAKYEPEFEARLNTLPIKDRLDKNVIANIKKDILASHFNEIVEEVKETERAAISAGATPPAMPSINSVSGSPTGNQKNVPLLSKEQELIALRMGVDPKAVEQHINSKPEAKGFGKYIG